MQYVEKPPIREDQEVGSVTDHVISFEEAQYVTGMAH